MSSTTSCASRLSSAFSVTSGILSWRRSCDDLGCCYSWQPGESPKRTNGKKTTTCCTDNFVPVVAVAEHTTAPPLDTSAPRHDTARGNPVPRTEVEETSERMIGEDAVLVRTSPVAKKKKVVETPLRKHHILPQQPMRGGDPHADARQECVIGKKSTVPNHRDITMCLRISKGCEL